MDHELVTGQPGLALLANRTPHAMQSLYMLLVRRRALRVHVSIQSPRTLNPKRGLMLSTLKHVKCYRTMTKRSSAPNLAEAYFRESPPAPWVVAMDPQALAQLASKDDTKAWTPSTQRTNGQHSLLEVLLRSRGGGRGSASCVLNTAILQKRKGSAWRRHLSAVRHVSETWLSVRTPYFAQSSPYHSGSPCQA